MSLVIALLITIVIEGIVVYILTRSFEWVKFNLYCNLVTNPVLNMALRVIMPLLGLNVHIVTYVVGEGLVILVETFFYKMMSREPHKRCFLISLISNVVSVILGMLVMNVLF